jgi:acyl-CoA thioesterase
MSADFAERFNPLVADALKEHTGRSPFAGRLGLRVEDVSPGRVVCGLTVGPEHMSGVGAVHGGAIVSLVDHALSLAVYPLVEVGKWVATVEFKINYLDYVQSGELRAVADVLSLRRRMAVVRVDVKNEERHVATAQGTVYIRDRLK